MAYPFRSEAMSKTFPESPQLAAYMGLLYGYEDSEPSERPNHRSVLAKPSTSLILVVAYCQP
jgi:hypothetical protein